MIAFVASTALCFALGVVVELTQITGMSDFRQLFYGSRALLHEKDPYQPRRVLEEFTMEREDRLPDLNENNPSRDIEVLVQTETTLNYLPSALLLVMPLALLPWGAAHIVWMVLTAGMLTAAGFLVLRPSSPANPVTTPLVCIMMANCEWALFNGNAAGLSTAACIIAIWCLINERAQFFGVVLLSISIAIKPHNAGLMWLFLLLAGGTLRRRALQSLALLILIAGPAVLWASSIAPHWLAELGANMKTIGPPAAVGNSLPSASTNSLFPIINLQTLLALFWNDPRFYDWTTYAVVGSLFLILAFATFRSPTNRRMRWLALAVVAPLELLVVYHRAYDARLLALTIPACGYLWARDGMRRWLALGLTGISIIATADIPIFIFAAYVPPIPLQQTAGLSRLLCVFLARPIPVVLLATAIFYLVVYVRETLGGPPVAHAESAAVPFAEGAVH